MSSLELPTLFQLTFNLNELKDIIAGKKILDKMIGMTPLTFIGRQSPHYQDIPTL